MADPVVNHFDTTIFLNSVINATDMFSAFDPDGDLVATLRFQDFNSDNSSSFFRLNGVDQTNGGTFDIALAELTDLEFVGGSRIANEGFRVIAFTVNGEVSDFTSFGTAYTVRANTTQPVVNETTFAVLANESDSIDRFITATDPDGYPITQYYIKDNKVDRGYLSLNGNQLAQNSFTLIQSADMANLKYHTTGLASTEELYVFAYDGAAWSKRGVISVDTLLNANRPVPQFANMNVISRDVVPLEPFAKLIDDDGNSIKWYEFWNTSPHATHGDMVLNGNILPRKTWIRINANQIDDLEYAAPNRNLLQQIRFRGSDGKFRSGEATITISTTYEDPPPPKIRPFTNQEDKIVVRQLQEFQVNNLFTWPDMEFDEPFRFQAYDSNTSQFSGNLEVDDEKFQAGVIHDFDVAGWNNLDFRSGAYVQRSIDGLYTRVGNDKWGRWERTDFHTEPEFDQAFFNNQANPNSWRRVLGASAETLVLTYSFMQQFPQDPYNTGEAVNDNGEFSAYTPQQRSASNEIFRNIETFANVEFQQIPDSATNQLGQQGGLIRMGNYFLDTSMAAAFAFFPSASEEGGDIWFNKAFGSTTNWDKGRFEFLTQQHELGHALGLKHPHGGLDGNGAGPYLPPATDNSFHTVMTYTSVNPSPHTYALYDMYNLQTLYGANMSFATGDDTYDFGGFLEGDPTAFKTIWDAGGNDTISAASLVADSLIDLRCGQFSSLGGTPLAIAFGADIENGRGGDGADNLIGNHLDNSLVGGRGNDEIWGGAGDDMLTGAHGNDTFRWGVADHNDTINEMAFAGTDKLILNDFPQLNLLEEDLIFRREGRDLFIDLNLDNGENEGTLQIINQKWGRYQVETLTLDGVDIDLKALYGQVVPGDENRFTLDTTSGTYGRLVIPV